MRKLVSILLLGLVLQYTLGLHIVYFWNVAAIKQSMRSSIAAGTFRHSQIVTFTIPIRQLSNTQGGCLQEAEVELNGKMYDVVATRQAGDSLAIKAICDNDETELVNTYQQVMGSGQQPLPEKNIACLKSFFSPFIISSYRPFGGQAVSVASCQLLYAIITFPPPVSSKVLTPPPRFA